MSDQIMENNAGFQPGPMNPVCSGGQLYTVKPGDTMFFIAKRNNISLQVLINANPQVADPNTIYPGQVLCIPMAGPLPSCGGNQSYRVVSGDTMFEIARRFGITLDALIAANPQIADPNLIFPGQEICVPVPSAVTPIPAPMPAPVSPIIPAPGPCFNGTLYTVRPGDTLFEIARANNISLTALIGANPQIPDPNLIYPGQVICIPGLVEVPAPLPVMPIRRPRPCPAPRPFVPIEQPIPRPAPRPVAPIEQPMPLPLLPAPIPCPAPRPFVPIEQPMPLPSVPVPIMPCPAQQPMMCPMPFYVVVPWDQCPHRMYRKKKHGHRKKRCQSC